MPIEKRALGSQGLVVGAQGLGCMGMTAFYGEDDPASKKTQYLEVFAKAKELGVDMLDTAYIYTGSHGLHNETVVGEAISTYGRDTWKIATKFGIDFASKDRQFNSDPAVIRRMLAESLQRLGTDCIDLYYQHRPDPQTPMETVAACLKELKHEGKIRYWGMSECTAEELRKAHSVFPVTAVQCEWSLQTRDAERHLVPTARELGVGLVCYSPLGRGFLSQTFTKREDLSASDWRLTQPRFSAEAFDKNAAKAAALRAFADKKGCTPAQVALGWLHAQGKDVFPIPGTTKASRLAENVGALSVVLAHEECKQIEAMVPEAEGDRYGGMWGTFNQRLNL